MLVNDLTHTLRNFFKTFDLLQPHLRMRLDHPTLRRVERSRFLYDFLWEMDQTDVVKEPPHREHLEFSFFDDPRGSTEKK